MAEAGEESWCLFKEIRSVKAFLLIISSASEGIYVTPCFVCRQ